MAVASIGHIVITHVMATAYGIADRVVLLAGGVIAAEGVPERVFQRDDERIRPSPSRAASIQSSSRDDLIARPRPRSGAAGPRAGVLATEHFARVSRAPFASELSVASTAASTACWHDHCTSAPTWTATSSSPPSTSRRSRTGS
jgi:ABC-type glutathione transport system ATPase component